MKKILVLGDTGFIGTAICARLISQGVSVKGVSRSGSRRVISGLTHMNFDVAQAQSPEDWLMLLQEVSGVVNCVGRLHHDPGTMRRVHVRGIEALYLACERAGIRRVVHLSAAGADHPMSAFSRTKQEGEQALMARDLDWVILRPSVVIGRTAYGGSALMRGLASLPIVPVFPEQGLIQPLMLDDVVDTAIGALRPEAPRQMVLDLVGPQRFQFTEVVGLLRQWLGWAPAVHLPVSNRVASLVYALGDIAGRLGWSTPIATMSRREMSRGATGDPGPWSAFLGRPPADLASSLRSSPASVQERWFAALYILKPLIFVVFALFWIVTGLISLGPGWQNGLELMDRGGVSQPWASWTVVAGALADIAIGCAILFRPTSRIGLHAALAISLVYAVIGTILLPSLWSEPLGPMLKIWPIMALNLVALAIRDGR